MGGAVGLGTEGLNGTEGGIATIGSAMILGGATAELTGGEFWKGAVVSGIVAGANDVAHRLGEDMTERVDSKRSESKEESGPGPLGQKFIPKRSNYPEGAFGTMLYKLDLLLFQSSFFPTLGHAQASRHVARGVAEGSKLFGKTVQKVITRMGRDGNALNILFKDGSKIDITVARVKQFIPNTHPKAPPGTLQRVKFDNAIPGSKGFKRLPTEEELNILKSFFN